MRNFKRYGSFVKLEHSVFSLPVVFAGAWLGLRGWPSWRLAGLLLAATVSGRALGMALNRLADAEIDARNPRTRNRELPRKAITPEEGWLIAVAAAIVYAAAAWAIAPICLKLSPIPAALFFIYPYLKRVTALAHAGLGLAWSMGPLGGWIAAKGSLQGLSGVGWLWLFSFCWVTGFDVIYATMDEAFDREWGLHSLPAAIGKKKALLVSAFLHAVAWLALALLSLNQLHDIASLVCLLAIGVLFVWQNRVAEKKPEFSFFKLNSIIGFLAFTLIVTGI